jgi:hypothetical protein
MFNSLGALLNALNGESLRREPNGFMRLEAMQARRDLIHYNSEADYFRLMVMSACDKHNIVGPNDVREFVSNLFYDSCPQPRIP